MNGNHGDKETLIISPTIQAFVECTVKKKKRFCGNPYILYIVEFFILSIQFPIPGHWDSWAIPINIKQ